MIIMMEEKMTKISIVMPVYREKEIFVRQAIESILKQTLLDFEYIIILDDPENEKLMQVINEYTMKDDRIKFYVNETNMGCPLTKNKGIHLCETEYIAIMDADDISCPERLERQLKSIQSENADFLSGYVSVINEEGNIIYNMDNLPLHHKDIVKKMRVNNCMPHPAWLFKRSSYMALGGYADMQGCEDYDLLIRAIRSGYKLGNCDHIVLKYRLSGQSISRNNLFKQYLMMRYIQDKYFYHKLSFDSYEQYEKVKFTEKKAVNYAKAAQAFEQALIYKNQNRYFLMLKECCEILVSKAYVEKIMRYIFETIL